VLRLRGWLPCRCEGLCYALWLDPAAVAGDAEEVMRDAVAAMPLLLVEPRARAVLRAHGAALRRHPGADAAGRGVCQRRRAQRMPRQSLRG